MKKAKRAAPKAGQKTKAKKPSTKSRKASKPAGGGARKGSRRRPIMRHSREGVRARGPGD